MRVTDLTPCVPRAWLAMAILGAGLISSSVAGTDSFDGGELGPDWVVQSTGQAEYSVHVNGGGRIPIVAV